MSDNGFSVAGASSAEYEAPINASPNLAATFDEPTVDSDFVLDEFNKSVKFGSAVALEGDRVLIGAPYDDTEGTNSGQAHIFDATTGALVQTLDDPTARGFENYGAVLALDGNRALIGSAGGGEVHLFDTTTGSLVQTLDSPAPADEDKFGDSIAIDGDRALIGAPTDDTRGDDAGQAYLFNAETGDLLQTLNHPTTLTPRFENFGQTVAVDGNRMLISDENDQAHLFDTETGDLIATLDDPTPSTSPFLAGDNFGDSISFDGDKVLVGDPLDNTRGENAGQAHLFDALTGDLLRTFDNPTAFGDDSRFGTSVALDDNRVLISAPNDDEVHLFDAATGDLTASLDRPAGEGIFGRSIALDGQDALIGDPYDDTLGEDVGRAYLFDLSENTPPAAVDDSAVARAGTAVVIDVLENDSDEDVNALKIARVSESGSGQVEITTDDQVRYNPDTGFTGMDTFTYTVSDGQGSEDTGRVDVTVEAPNRAPTLIDIAAQSIDENGPVGTTVVTASAADPDGDTLAYSLGGADAGLFSIDATSGAITLDVSPDFENPADADGDNTYELTVSAADPGGEAVSDSVTVEVRDINEAPKAADDRTATARDMAVTLTTAELTGNDEDPDGDRLAINAVENASNGSAVLNSDGTVTFRPDAGFTGTGRFTYTVGDGNGRTDKASVMVNVNDTAADGSPSPAVTFDDPTATNADYFGTSVALSGDQVLVGAPYDDTLGKNVGQAHLLDGETGDLLQTFDDPSPANFNNFGASVALDEGQVVIGSGSGDQAHLFSAETGNRLATFNDPTVSGDGDGFGAAVALSGNWVLVGEPYDDTQGDGVGQAHLFNAGTGDLLQTFDDPSPTRFDNFGAAVALDGDRVLIGALRDDTQGNNVGQAHLFDTDTGNLLQTFDDPTVSNTDRFGASVALDGGRVLIGADSDSTQANDVGQAHLFDAETGDLLQTFDDPTVTGSDNFGTAVALYGDRVLVGARFDDTRGEDVGQAYLFDATTGELLATLNNPTANDDDRFGAAVGLSGSSALVGARYDDTQGKDVGQAHLFDLASNAPPDAADDQAATDTGTAVRIDVVANDRDEDGDRFSVTSVDDPTNGTASITEDDRVSYSPDDGFTGTDTFTYTVSDGQGGQDTAQVDVTVGLSAALETEVSQLYVGLIGRAPDRDGLEFWARGYNRDLDKGESADEALREVAQRMFDSEGARDYYPEGLSDQQIVEQFYENVLGRQGDTAGVAFWTDALAKSSTDTGDVLVSMIDSVTGYSGDDPAGVKSQQLFESKAAIADYYVDNVSQAGDAADIAGATALLDAVTEDTDTTSENAVGAFVSEHFSGTPSAGGPEPYDAAIEIIGSSQGATEDGVIG